MAKKTETRVTIEKKVLSKNDEVAADIRRRLQERKIVALNLVSSPGSGKTSLLERTLERLAGKLNLAIIAGDVQTQNDADRLARAGAERVQPIVTGGACHLDAQMVSDALDRIDLSGVDVLFVENVGNLVCPAGFDLGEDMKVVVMSTTEGDDKPLKYPTMFRRSSVLIINKTDLLAYSDFDLETAKKNAWSINADLRTFDLSCRTGAGLDAWFQWLSDLAGKRRYHERPGRPHR